MSNTGHPPPWHNTHNAISGLRYVRSRSRLDRDQNENEFHGLDAELERIAGRAHYVSSDRAGREQWRSTKSDHGLRMIVDPRGARGRALPKLVWVGQGKPPESVWTP